MWALCPPSYHDNDMPIDLRKKVVLQRELDEQRDCYQDSEDSYAPKDYSIKEYRDRWQRPSLLPVGKLYPLVAEKYGAQCAVVPTEDRDKPQDLRPTIRGTLETAIKKLHNNSKLKQSQENIEERCRSAEALLDRGSSESSARSPRSNSCPDLSTLEPREEEPDNHKPLHSTNEITASEIKNYSEYNGYSPEHEDVNSHVIGGARKRKSFVPLYGDRAPVYERAYRSPSPQNLVFHRNYRSPSPKKPVYIRNGYHSPSPESPSYQERVYRSPSPPRPLYIERHYYSPSPTRSAYDERRYRSPSPKRPAYLERAFRSPSPKRRPKSPTEHAPYEEYFSHPEVLLRRQLNQQSTSPYFLHVYDYYQHLVQRLREHSSPNVRISSPVSPPIEEDTNPDAQRKRPCRALTGKHVRQGTGASLSTLLTLRQKIQERQKAKEHQPRNALNGVNKNGNAKKNSPKKVKVNMKSTLNKIQNC